MHEMAQMQQALGKLIASCHGDDDPHCAILEELAADSPQAPPAGAVTAMPLRKEPAKPSARGEPAAHLDLMAWTRGLHAGHGYS